MELFVIIVNRFQPLTIITKCPILGVAAVLDPALVKLMDTRPRLISHKTPYVSLVRLSII